MATSSGTEAHPHSSASAGEAPSTFHYSEYNETYNPEPIQYNEDPLFGSTGGSYHASGVEGTERQAFLAHTVAMAQYQESLMALQTEAGHPMPADVEAPTSSDFFDLRGQMNQGWS